MSHKGVSAAEHFSEKCPVPSNATAKDFVRWYCKSREGRLGKMPNDTSAGNSLSSSVDLRGLQRQRYLIRYEQMSIQSSNIGEQALRDQWTHLILYPLEMLILPFSNFVPSLNPIVVLDALRECEDCRNLREILSLLI